MVVLITCKYEEDPIKNEGARVDTTFSPLQPYGSYLLPWKPEFRSYLVQNLMQSIPHPNDASDKIWLRLAHWLRRYSSLKMFTDARTHGRTSSRDGIYVATFSYFGYLCGYLPMCGLDTQESILATKVSNLRNKSHLYSKMTTCVSNCPNFIATGVPICLCALTDGRTPDRPVYYKLTFEPSAQVS